MAQTIYSMSIGLKISDETRMLRRTGKSQSRTKLKLISILTWNLLNQNFKHIVDFTLKKNYFYTVL
jgi:hypothetical protein